MANIRTFRVWLIRLDLSCHYLINRLRTRWSCSWSNQYVNALLRSGRRSQIRLEGRIIGATVVEHRPDYPRPLVGQGDQRHVGWATFRQSPQPGLRKVRILLAIPPHGTGAADQQPPEIAIVAFTDTGFILHLFTNGWCVPPATLRRWRVALYRV